MTEASKVEAERARQRSVLLQAARTMTAALRAIADGAKEVAREYARITNIHNELNPLIAAWEEEQWVAQQDAEELAAFTPEPGEPVDVEQMRADFRILASGQGSQLWTHLYYHPALIELVPDEQLRHTTAHDLATRAEGALYRLLCEELLGEEADHA